MCPVCLATTVLSVAGASTGAGALALTAARWRNVQRWCRDRVRALF